MQRDAEKIRFTLRSDNIVQIECSPNTVMTLEDGKLSTRMVGEIINGSPLPLLCDLTNVVKMTQDCRKHFAGAEHASVFSKCALIVNSPLSKIIGNFFLGANRPLRPTRLFTKTEDGIKWLKK
ncbi:MAG TPA: STAS/SEC14 domain-containing protein [Cyclobacteriaceae bacterium]|nr:STAS/SEC14 domain-containing protein [Cyclobacteriaceae bacterium]